MRWNFRIDRQLGGHTHLSLFVNGARSGELVLRNEEVDTLRELLSDPARSGELTLQLTFGPAQHERIV